MKDKQVFKQVNNEYCVGPIQMINGEEAKYYNIDKVIVSTQNSVNKDILKKGVCYSQKDNTNRYEFTGAKQSVQIVLNQDDIRNGILKKYTSSHVNYVAKKVMSKTAKATSLIMGGIAGGVVIVTMMVGAHEQTTDRYANEIMEQRKNMPAEQSQSIIDYEQRSQEISSNFPELNFYSLDRDTQNELIDDYNRNGKEAITDYLENEMGIYVEKGTQK